MLRLSLCAGLLLATVFPVLAQSDTDRAKVLGGVAGIVYAEEVCDFNVDADALADYLSERGILSPESMAEMNAAVLIAQATKAELTKLQCAMQEAVAKEMGVIE